MRWIINRMGFNVVEDTCMQDEWETWWTATVKSHQHYTVHVVDGSSCNRLDVTWSLLCVTCLLTYLYRNAYHLSWWQYIPGRDVNSPHGTTFHRVCTRIVIVVVMNSDKVIFCIQHERNAQQCHISMDSNTNYVTTHWSSLSLSQDLPIIWGLLTTLVLPFLCVISWSLKNKSFWSTD